MTVVTKFTSKLAGDATDTSGPDAMDTMNDLLAGGRTLMKAMLLAGVYPLRSNNYIDLIADSRTYDQGVNSTPVGQTGVHLINHANAQSGGRFIVNANHGWSGSRSDQWLQGLDNSNPPVKVRGGIDAMVASSAGWFYIGFPIVNDLAQSAAGYIDTISGVAVTATNVADVAFGNIKPAILRLLATGKRGIVTPEPGATNLPVAAIRQLHRFNYLLRRLVETTDRLYMWNPLKVLWANTTPTAISMVAGVMRNGDPTHYSVIGGLLLGREFAATFAPMFPFQNFKPISIHDNPSSNPGQMTPNALFTRVKGDGLQPAFAADGVVSGGLVLTSGTVPAGYEIKGSASSSVAITIADEPNGYGKVVTFAITTTAADVVQIIANAPSSGAWNLTDNFQQQVDLAVAAGSANAWAYGDMQINTNLGTDSYYALYADGSYGPFPTFAYNHQLISQVGKVKEGSTAKGYVNARIGVRFTAAGNITMSLSCPDFRRF